MAFRAVYLPGPVILVPGKTLEGKIRRQAHDHPGLPTDPAQIAADLNARPDGVPVTFSEPRDSTSDWSLLVYTRAYLARLFLTKKYRDAYTIAAVSPLRLRDHHRLAEGYLHIRAQGWRVAYDPRQIPPGSAAHWDQLFGEWRKLDAELATERAAPPVTEPQTIFLDRIDRVIDATAKIEMEEARSAPPFPYRRISSTTERRYGRHATYVFELMPGQQPDEGDFVQVRGEPQQRGQVTRVVDDSVTVRFDERIDWDRIPQPGELEQTPSSVVYDKQREAVALLRDRRAHNPHLLSVLVDHTVRRIPSSTATSAESLDEDQLAAFRRALTVPDMLLVLGPPGTGKTRTISQIARTCALERGERVLVTSHSNRAVDNVLRKLPRDVEAIRVGHEGSVTEEGLPYLLGRRAAELRERILNATGRSVAAYATIAAAAAWARQLDERADDLVAALTASSQAADELARARRAAGGPAQVRVDQLTTKVNRLTRKLNRNQIRVRLLVQGQAWLAARAKLRLAGPLLALLAHVSGWVVDKQQRQAERLRDADNRLAEELTAAEMELETRTRGDPAVGAARDRLDQTAGRRVQHREAALTAAHALQAAVVPVDTVPPVRDAGAGEPAAIEQDLLQLRDWAKRELPLITGRKTVLTEWHQEVSEASDQLYPELIRYADVIAATSIGVASRPELSGVDFDLTILDEAGQIGIADALVPLVRARRGVLVGDHNQLPPFLSSEVDAWGAGVGDPVISTILAKSALEILVDELPSSHITALTWQRRMPEVIADFVSASFYKGTLRTDTRAITRTRDDAQRDPLFGAALAFVDTSPLPAARRGERSGRARESWGQAGYINPAEADLLTALALFYHRSGADWAVIAPYRAQVAMIRAGLTPGIGDARLAGLNVGTVDSFQGGERDVILYGFTRCNTSGHVGFLRELRRMNVTFSRARQQLVLVGDMDTLVSAKDPAFGELARSLHGYLTDRGEMCQYHEVQKRLNDRGRWLGDA